MTDKNKKTLEEIHNYWINRSLPKLYLNQVKRSEFLTEYIKKYVISSDRILEIGCNAGRNLNHLKQHNYKHLTGIEISEEAIRELKKSFPSLYKNAEIIHAPIENVIKQLPSNHYDLVFTMAVLEHIHPDSEWIFQDMARIAKSFVITVEAENAEHWRVFPRNYKKIFEKYGLKQLEEARCDKDLGLGAYTIRVLKKN
ncbi:class I SAM-dependent methyltransferase [Ornithinibacillus salinisoli]|uniref:Class I SAM-dependent methyltransferase n=1 Tax=Ornithinibacillus salinisoli TaxID=1848459 RepID=A0ABW4W4N2_9BACI